MASIALKASWVQKMATQPIQLRVQEIGTFLSNFHADHFTAFVQDIMPEIRSLMSTKYSSGRITTLALKSKPTPLLLRLASVTEKALSTFNQKHRMPS